MDIDYKNKYLKYKKKYLDYKEKLKKNKFFRKKLTDDELKQAKDDNVEFSRLKNSERNRIVEINEKDIIKEMMELGSFRIIQPIKYPNGDVYDGEIKNATTKDSFGDILVYEIRDGHGKYIYTDGTVYEGNWKNDKKHGKGKIIYSDGEVYEGEWKNGKMDGKGKYTYSNGEVQEGLWKDNKFVK